MAECDTRYLLIEVIGRLLSLSNRFTFAIYTSGVQKLDTSDWRSLSSDPAFATIISQLQINHWSTETGGYVRD